MKPKLGDWVTYERKILRVHQGGTSKWEPTPWASGGRGLFIGWRTLQQGRTEYGWDEEPNYFKETGPRTKAALVVVDTRHKPIYVDPNGLEIESE